MISVIGACERWGAKIAVDAIREVCPACVTETGLALLGDEDEDTISHARLPHSEVCWDPSRGNLRFEKIVPHCTEVVSGFLTKRSKLRVPLTSKLPTKNAHNGRATKLEAA